MQFKEAKTLMKELNTPHIRVIGPDGKRIYDLFNEVSVENAIAKLESLLPTLRTYGRVNFIAGTDAHKKQHFKDAYQWPITFEGTNEVIPHIQGDNAYTGIKTGYVSALEADLKAQLAAMTMQMTLQKQIDELSAKINGAKEPDKWEKLIDKYLPMAGMVFKIDDEKMANMSKIASLQAMSNTSQNSAGINGLNIQQKPKELIQGTEEEKKLVAEIITEMDKLEEKISAKKILALIKGLNEKPEFADQAITFMTMNKTT